MENKKRVTELSVEQLRALIDDVIDEKFIEWFGDPDEGLELRPEVIRKLKESLKRWRRGEKGIPMEEVAREHGIKLEE